MSGGRRNLGIKSIRIPQKGGGIARAREAEVIGKNNGFVILSPDSSMEVRDNGPATRAAGADEALKQRARAMLPGLGSHNYNW